ncbi:MAG: hypothetical protein C0602_01085 [Denitrovibrio sp.]|nr:MAG: hypothetical protein C0602_01085 [Denitrovibrio sp.]
MSIKKLLITMAVAAVLIVPAAGFSDTIAEGERLGKTCAGCHGTAGNTPGTYIGKIGGQNSAYMSKVLKEFSADKRPASVEMSIVAKGYSDIQLESVAAYYASLKWVNSDNPVDSKKILAGKAMASDNGCLDCHGIKGEGIGEFPRIGGQNKGYLYEVMKRYRSGDISSDEMSMLSDFSDDQLDQLANFFSGIR